MNHKVKIESLLAKGFLAIKGYGKIYDPGIINTEGGEFTWETIRKKFADGSVECLISAKGTGD